MTATAQPEKKPLLTKRQSEVLRLLASGKTIREAGVSLGLAAKTVSVHTAALYKRLGIHNRTDLVKYAPPAKQHNDGVEAL